MIINKFWQIFFLFLPVSYYFISKSSLLTLFFPIAILLVLADFLSKYNQNFAQVLLKFIKFDNLSNKISDLSYFTVACLLVILFFNQSNAINALLVAIICPITGKIIEENFQMSDFFEKNLSFAVGFFASGVLILIANYAILDLSFGYLFFALIALIAATIIACRPSLSSINPNFLLISSFATTIGCFSLIWQI